MSDPEIMKDFFRGKLKADLKQDYTYYGNIGYGLGIGTNRGNYALYIKKLRSGVESPVAYIGQGVSIDNNDYMSIVEPTSEFLQGHTPTVLIKYFNLIDETMIRLVWSGPGIGSNDRHAGYNIPSPYSMRYDWWDEYGVYFTAPEGLMSGQYHVHIDSTELKAVMTANQPPPKNKVCTVDIDFDIV